MTDLPELGHIDGHRRIEVAEAISRAHYLARGRHLLIGQRKKRGETDALIYLGKCIENTRVSNRFDANVWLDVRTPHVVYICGKRGSGKSYDLGVLAEGLLLGGRSHAVSTLPVSITTVLFDTQSQFWTLGLAPDRDNKEDEQQLRALSVWGLSPSAVPGVQLYKPRGQPSDLPNVLEFSISAMDLDLDDWCGLFGLDRFTPQGQCMKSVLGKVSQEGYEREEETAGLRRRVRIAPTPEFSIPDLIACLLHDVELQDHAHLQTRNAILWKMQALEGSNLFSRQGTSVDDLLTPGRLSVFLLRELDNATKALVVSVLSKKIMSTMGQHHTRLKIARRHGTGSPVDGPARPAGVWVMIDEAHLICPADSQTAAKPTLIEFVKRGRDAGLSLVLATQQPSAVDTRVISQVDLLLVHRLVVDADIHAAVSRMPARFPSTVSIGTEKISDPSSLIRMLDTGEAWIGDAESGRAFLAAMRPRVTAHGGDEPVMV